MTTRIRACCLFLFAFALCSWAAIEPAGAQSLGDKAQEFSSPANTVPPPDLPTPAPSSRAPADSWAPPDVNSLEFSALDNEPCSASDIVPQAGQRVEELVHNLDRYSATEVIQHQTVNRSGKLNRPEYQDFNYVFSMAPGRDGYMVSDEYRNGNRNAEEAIEEVVTRGTSSLVLVFHPNYTKNFLMTCEGLGSWRGRPAWLIRFEERPESTHRMSAIAVEGRVYGIRLRGMGWILADSFQVAHMEMDAAESIPRIRLRLQHIAIDYGPVGVPGTRTKIWLPWNAELYLDFRGHRFYRRHSYTDFKIFSVKVDQEFSGIR
jgi:hypothetical protein